MYVLYEVPQQVGMKRIYIDMSESRLVLVTLLPGVEWTQRDENNWIGLGRDKTYRIRWKDEE